MGINEHALAAAEKVAVDGDLAAVIQAYLDALPSSAPTPRGQHHNRPYDEFSTHVNYGVRIGMFNRDTFPLDPAAMESFGAQLVFQCHGASVAAGWWQDPATGESLLDYPIVSEKLALIHSEISEALEGHRKRKPDDHLPHRPSIEVELADAVIRIGDLAGVLHLDLGGAIAEKMEYNARRPDHDLKNRAKEDGKTF